MAATFEVRGGKQLRSSLRKAGDDLSDLKGAHKEAADVAAGTVRNKAPEVSGKLAATVRGAGTKTAGIVRVGNNTSVKYANPIQWGWPKRNIVAHHFASDGVTESEPRWLPIYMNYIDSTINQIEGI